MANKKQMGVLLIIIYGTEEGVFETRMGLRNT